MKKVRKMSKSFNKLQWKIAWWVPRWLVYLCAVRLMAYATQGKYSDQVVPELKGMDALRRW